MTDYDALNPPPIVTINGMTDPAAQVRDVAAILDLVLMLAVRPDEHWEEQAREAALSEARSWLTEYQHAYGIKPTRSTTLPYQRDRDEDE